MNPFNLIKNYQFIYKDEDYFYLYRHQSFASHYVQGLENSTLYFSSPSNFNDPFDSYFSLEKQPDKEFHNQILKNLKIKGNPAQNILNRKKSQFLLSQSFKEGSFFEERFNRIGVICLNHSPLNILMWSHYADYHRGFLLEFKFPRKVKNLEKLNFFPFPVNYSNSFPTGALTGFDEEVLYNMLYTKAEDWVYEKEFRVIGTGFETKDDHENRIFNYPQNWLSPVILGCNTEINNSQKINNVLKKNGLNIPIYKVKKLSNNFGLTVPNHPRLDVLGK